MLINAAKNNGDTPMGGGLEIRGNESHSGYTSAANQTAYSGGFLVDPS